MVRRLALLGGLLTFAAAVAWSVKPEIARGVSVPDGASGPDEAVYLAYAMQIQQTGAAGFPALFENFLRNAEARRYYPSPVRILTIATDALAVSATGPRFVSLQLRSFVFFLALLALTFLSLERLADMRTAVCTTLLLAVSPLQLGMAGRALADTPVNFWAAASVWALVAALVAPQPGHRRWPVVWLTLTAALLAKEANFILLLPIMVALAIASLSRRPAQLGPMLAACALAASVSLLLMRLCAGGWSPLFRTLMIAWGSAASNSYAIDFGSGPWYRYILDFFLLSPWTALGYLLWVGLMLAGCEEPRYARLWAAVPWLFLLCAAPITKNVRFALLLDLPIRLGTVLLLQRILPRWAGRHALVVMALAMLALIFADLRNFRQLFLLEHRIYDPVSIELLRARHLLPLRLVRCLEAVL